MNEKRLKFQMPSQPCHHLSQAEPWPAAEGIFCVTWWSPVQYEKRHRAGRVRPERLLQNGVLMCTGVKGPSFWILT